MNLRILTASLFLASASLAQIVVNPAGGGNYTALQPALDAAPDGATIRVVGGYYEAITIRKSVTIVGDPAPRIASPESGSGAQPAAITLAGTGTQTLRMSRVLVTGRTNGASFGMAGAAVGGTGFARIRIHDCTLLAPEWYILTGSARGASALAISGSSTIHIERSTLRASKSDVDSSHVWVLDGAPAIDAPAATVVLLDSQVTGGGVGPSTWPLFPPNPTPCPCTNPGQTGRGGIGIVASTLYQARSVISGGRGGEVTYMNQPYGRQPDGAAVAVTTQRVLDDSSIALTPLQVGRVFEIFFLPPPTVSGAMALGLVAASPIRIDSTNFLFVDPASMSLLPLASGATSFRLPVPALPALTGLELAFQRVDYTTPSLRTSNPILSVILP